MAKTSVTDLTVFDIDGMKCFERDGVAYLHLETCARGLGFTRRDVIDGVEYTNVQWRQVDGYLREFGVLAAREKDADLAPKEIESNNSSKSHSDGENEVENGLTSQVFVHNLHKNNFLTKSFSDEKNGPRSELTSQDLLQNWSKPVFDSFMNEGTKSTNDNDSTSQVFVHLWTKDNSLTNVRETFRNLKERPEFIPEPIFYRLAMKGRSEAAKAFQDKIAWEVIPSIRKRGYYSAYGSEAETIAAVVADMNDKDKRKTIIKALQEANIKQADFIREYLGERNMRIPPSIEAMSDRNASAKYLMRGWGDRKFSQRSMPEPYNTDWQIPAYLKMMARSKVHGHHFVKFCGEYYFDKLGYMALIEKMYKNKKLKRDYAQAWYDAVDQL